MADKRAPSDQSRSLRGPRRRTGVLFVCYANICRSPLAEGIFRHLVRERGLERAFAIDSAGVAALVGAAPYVHSVSVARRNGVTLSGKSRQLVRADLYRFQHILLLDRVVEARLNQLCPPPTPGAEPVHDPRGRVRLLATLTKPGARGAALDIHDPISEPESAFEQTFEQISANCRALLHELTS